VSPQVWGAGGDGHTTNNVMELQAIRQALLFTPTDMPLVIETDSAYSISCFSSWITGWASDGSLVREGGEESRHPSSVEGVSMAHLALVRESSKLSVPNPTLGL